MIKLRKRNRNRNRKNLTIQWKSKQRKRIVSDGRRGGIGRKRKPSDPSDSDSVELPIAIDAFPASDFDSASDYVANGSQLC